MQQNFVFLSSTRQFDTRTQKSAPKIRQFHMPVQHKCVSSTGIRQLNPIKPLKGHKAKKPINAFVLN